MNDLVKEFMRKMNSVSEKEYMYNLITYGIAPTVCGFKAATLISLSSKYKNTYNLWKEHGEEYLGKVSVKNYELNRTEDSYTLLFYDEEMLKDRIRQKKSMSFLADYGYEEEDNLMSTLNVLKERYRLRCPHEVGLFLDIPLEDILGFIENKGKNYLYCGYWKVYCNLERALKTFESYDQSKKKVINLLAGGEKAFQVIKELQLSKII